MESTNDRETLDAYIGHTSEDEAAEFLEPRPDLCTDSPSVEEIRVCTASPSVKDMTFSAWLKSRNKGKKKGGNAANAGVHSLKDSGGEGIHLQPETQGTFVYLSCINAIQIHGQT